MISVQKAKSLVKTWLRSNGLDNRVTGKTVSFEGFGYGDKIFVTVHNWDPNSHKAGIWYDLRILAHGYNFIVEADLL